MTIYNGMIAACWLVFLFYWIVSAFSAKRTIGRRSLWRGGAWRLAVIVTVLLAVRLRFVHQALRAARPLLSNKDMAAGITGVALCVLGVGLAIWARAYLGRNWGMPMSRKENPDLVTSGPYAVIRHPIYTGMLLALFGSAIGVSLVWLLPLVLCGAYFIYSARREEKLMTGEFPQTYPAYKARTWMLVPYIW